MHEAHDAFLCVGEKTYVNENNRIIFCGSPIILLAHAQPKMLLDLKRFSRNFYNVLIKISKKNKIPYFSELLCLNDKIYYVNRISRVFYLEDKKLAFTAISLETAGIMTHETSKKVPV